MPQTADRNLLLGILALQVDFITHDALLAAMKAWVLEKHRPLEDILVDRGALDPADRDLLRPMVDRHIARHGGPDRSRAALSTDGRVISEILRTVFDTEVQASLGHARSSADAPATKSSDTDAPNPWQTRYRKVRDHARGGLGVVFVAHDRELNRNVALKEIQDHHADRPDSRARFLLEAEVTGGLEHPGIVPVYGLGQYPDGRPFYAMRFVRGRSLKDAIARFHADESLKANPGARTLALQKLLRRFLDVCDAIDYAHSRGVLHRDLKPDNIMVGKYGETLVVDWGLARATGRSGNDPEPDDDLPEPTLCPTSGDGLEATRHGSAIGTPQYMPPEQAAGRLDLLGPSSDVYSLGATLYALTTGKAPVSGTDRAEILSKVQSGDVPHPRTLSPWLDPALEAICLKSMSLRPEDRYRSPRGLADDVERWLADEPVTAHPEPFAERARRWAKRNRIAVAAAAALLMGLVGLSAVATMQTKARNDLDRKNDDLIAANKALDDQRLRAENREAQAINAVMKFRDAVANEPELKNSPALDGLRKRLLKEPLAFFGVLSHEVSGRASADSGPVVVASRTRSSPAQSSSPTRSNSAATASTPSQTESSSRAARGPSRFRKSKRQRS
jgi:serine/threonine protein kinase